MKLKWIMGVAAVMSALAASAVTMTSDTFSGTGVSAQWTAYPGGANSPVTVVGGKLTTTISSADGNNIGTSVASSTGYTLPAGNFSVQVDESKGSSSGWWQNCFLSVTIGGNTYYLRQVWQDGSTAPVYTTGAYASDATNINSLDMQFKIARAGTNLSFYAKALTDAAWTTIGSTTVTTAAATVSLGVCNSSGSSVSTSWDNFAVTFAELSSDSFAGTALGAQWATYPGGANSPVTVVGGKLTTTISSADGNYIASEIASTTGYALPAGNFSVQIDTSKGASSGWWQGRFLGIDIGSKTYQLRQEWRDGSTAPVYAVGDYGSGETNLNSTDMQFKMTRVGTVLSFYARPLASADWITIGSTSVTTADATVYLGVYNSYATSVSVNWDNFTVAHLAESVFDTQVLEGTAWAGVGSGDLLSVANGHLIFDSALDGNPYTWLTIYPVERMGGEFLAEFNFSILQMDYWNSFDLRVAALDGSWSARLCRLQNNWGDNEIAAYYTAGGAETLQSSISTTAYSGGTLRLMRSGTSLAFWWKPDNGAWQQIGSSVSVSASSVGAYICFSSAASTRSLIQLNSYHQEWAATVPRQLTPDYSGSTELLADEEDGAYLLRTENCDTSDPTQIKINAGGRAVYAVKGPLNAKNLSLAWQSLGAVKVSVTRLGGEESIELGQTLVWDTTPSSQMTARSVDLNGFVTRMASRRNWSLTHNTANNLFFVAFQPALSSQVALETGSVQLLGSALMPLPVFTPVADCTATATAYANGNWALSWSKPAGSATWWGEDILPTGTVATMGDIPFKVSPTVLGGTDGCGSVAVAIGRTAGLIHFAHCAGLNNVGGIIPLSQDWVGAYLIVYADGTTETVFCDLEWNCGVLSSGYRDLAGANYTWWGCPGYTMAKVQRLPWGIRNLYWASVYVTSYVNPHPEKTINRIIAFVPKENPQFALLGITLTDPANAYMGLVEPSKAAFKPADNFRADVMLWRAQTGALPSGGLWAVKTDQNTLLASGSLSGNGPFAMTSFTFAPQSYPAVKPGPVRLQYRDGSANVLATSSLLGWMPSGTQNFYLGMIGQAGDRGEYERIFRLGYDDVKIAMSGLDATSLTQLDAELNLINSVGLKASLRNTPPISGTTKIRTDGAANNNDPDKADPAYLTALVNYYTGVANFAMNYPYLISINANYGLSENIGANNVLTYGASYQWPNFIAYLQANATLATINSKSGTSFTAWNQITPYAVLAAADSSFLEANLLRSHNQNAANLQQQTATAIRNAGYTGHLAFNVSMPHQNQRWDGRPFDTYLTIGQNQGPASPYHESADRYSLSFFKWLAAKRTFGLPYGDEGCLDPPAYEQNAMAYQWMMMMQCWDALYCQWYYGNPGSQNIAWLKPYYQLIYDSAYQADPITLALSFESSYEEAKSTLAAGGHTPGLCHYGMANVLRETNLNADRYIIDKFSALDANATSKLILDDTSRYIDDGFANRLEAQIRSGKVFVVTGETDRLRNYSFLSRFGITMTAVAASATMTVKGDSGNQTVSFPAGATTTKYKVTGTGLTQYAYWNVTGSPNAVVSKTVGSGKIVVFGKAWDDGDLVGQMPAAYLDFCKSKFQTWGNFICRVKTSDADYAVHATPYLATDGTLYVLLFNTAAMAKTTVLSVRTNMIPGTSATDLGRGIALTKTAVTNYTNVTTTVPALSSTVIKFGSL